MARRSKAAAQVRAARKGVVRKNRRETVYKFTAKRYNGTVPCFVCGRHVKEQHATLEHIVHVADGGTDDLDNLAISHNQCNQRRSNSDLECKGRHFYERNGDHHSSARQQAAAELERSDTEEGPGDPAENGGPGVEREDRDPPARDGPDTDTGPGEESAGDSAPEDDGSPPV